MIGVEDSTLRIVGAQDFNNQTVDSVRQRLLERCRALDSEGFRVEPFTTDDTDKTVWVFHIPKHRSRMPVYAHDKAWQRLDDSLVEMRQERLEAILHEPLDANDWSAQIVEGATLDDLDAAAIAVARDKFAEKHHRAPFAAEIAGWDVATFLDKAKITIQGGVTRTALLLLGKPEASHFLPALAQITWKLVGEEQAYEHFGPPFLLSTTQVLHRIRNIGYKLFPQNQLLATEVSKYDTRVILEALHNCIAHQDYQLRSRILVTERVDRLVFENAGGFFEGQPEDYFSGEVTPSRYRNPWLAGWLAGSGHGQLEHDRHHGVWYQHHDPVPAQALFPAARLQQVGAGQGGAGDLRACDRRELHSPAVGTAGPAIEHGDVAGPGAEEAGNHR